MGVFYNSGQDVRFSLFSLLGLLADPLSQCCAGTRLYVDEKIYDKFLPMLIAQAEACAIGDVRSAAHSHRTFANPLSQPWDDATSFGPLISAAQRDKVLGYIESGIAEGAKVATGGKKWANSTGYYVEPTVLVDCTPDMKVVQEEIFGPVLVVSKFSSEEEVLKLANGSTYGLGAAVFTG